VETTIPAGRRSAQEDHHHRFAIAAHREAGILAVEMEAAALYAFSRARGCPVACFAHVTNTMAQSEGDFEKGEADGALEALALVATAARRWLGG